MPEQTPQHATARPLFAEWKLADAVREFGETIRIADTIPPIEIPLPASVTAPLTEDTAPPGDIPPYLPLLISGYHRVRRGRNFSFALSVAAGDHPPADLPVAPPAGYLTTLHRMHRHGFPLTGWDAAIASALAALSRRTSTQKYHRCRPLLLATDATRITLPEGSIYDLPLGRHLTADEAVSRDILRESHAAYRVARGYECTAPVHRDEQETFLTSDLHLGHHHAVRYYCRPFLWGDTDQMDRVLTKNWNHTVRPDDSVIFAGDFTYKADCDATDAYRSALNGTVTWIEGNHDTGMDDTHFSHSLTTEDRTFLVIHNPKHVPAGYRGWVIHGHTHNARLGDYPFISFTHKTVNVSTDVTGYRPVPLTEVLALIREGERAGRTAPILTRPMPSAPGDRV